MELESCVLNLIIFFVRTGDNHLTYPGLSEVLVPI